MNETNKKIQKLVEKNPFEDIVDFEDELFESVKKTAIEPEREVVKPRTLAEFKSNLKPDKAEEATEFDLLKDDLEGFHAQRMNEILCNLPDAKFTDVYMKLLGYIKPKMRAIDAIIKQPTELTQISVTVINSKEELIDVKDLNNKK